MMLRSLSNITGKSVKNNGVSRWLSADIKGSCTVRHITTLNNFSIYPAQTRKQSSLRKRRPHEHSHSTSAAASAAEDTDDDDNELDDALSPKLASPEVIHTTATVNKPRLQALREKLEKEPPAESFLAKPSAADASSTKASPKDIHWKELLRQSREAPPLAMVEDPPQQLINGIEQIVPKAKQEGVLTDRFGRHHNYLRISLAERCNLRCTYCMPPEGVPLQPESYLLQTPEILSLAQHFKNHGVNKIRLTGGEPTLRKDLVDILNGLKDMGGFQELAITTNGVTLAKNLDAYVEAGLNRVNISLDTLHADKFETLTRRPKAYFNRVWDAIEAAMRFSPEELITKINVVVMKGVNEDEVARFCELQQQFPNLHVRFIEYMPFSENGWDMDKWVPYRDLLKHLEQQDNVQLVKLPEVDPSDTTKWYTTLENSQALENNDSDGTAGIGRIGFITSMSQPFCGTCNRLRLTSDGQIKVCLFDGSSTISLRDAMREGASSQDLDHLIQHALRKKHFALGGHSSPEDILRDSDSNRPMTLIGG